MFFAPYGRTGLRDFTAVVLTPPRVQPNRWAYANFMIEIYLSGEGYGGGSFTTVNSILDISTPFSLPSANPVRFAMWVRYSETAFFTRYADFILFTPFTRILNKLR
jgi:hypothetical protein